VINILVPSANTRGLEYEFIPGGRLLITSKKQVPELSLGNTIHIIPHLVERALGFVVLFKTFAFCLLYRIETSDYLLHVCHNNTIYLKELYA
jgi:hypothetical protein